MDAVATSYAQIRKSDDDRQIIYGEVYAPNRLDSQGEMMLAEDIELMAHRFMQLALAETIDIRHNNKAIKAHPIESFIARKGDPDYTVGAWVLGVHIDDADVWVQIKKGELNGFSFQSLVSYVDADVDVEIVRDHVGKTEENDGHTHYYFAQLNENGVVVKGKTSCAADGHWHDLRGSTATEMASDHAHRLFV